ncbi:MAG: helix-turn-helix domain-containing protein [Candidatus Dormibacteria bacterium]
MHHHLTVDRDAAQAQLLSKIEWICQTLWLARRSEPELVQFQQERGSTGFPHYILSRAGIVPDKDWATVLYVLPPSLVDHLRPRCFALGPEDYFAACVEVGAEALRRLSPEARPGGLRDLARSSRPDGELPQAWFELPPGEGQHRQLLGAAMTLREARAYAHYRAASEQGLQALGLLMVTHAWEAAPDRASDHRFFRWQDTAVAAERSALVGSGWLRESGALTESGHSRRQAIEAKTDAHTERLLAQLSDVELDQLLQELPTLVE